MLEFAVIAILIACSLLVFLVGLLILMVPVLAALSGIWLLIKRPKKD